VECPSVRKTSALGLPEDTLAQPDCDVAGRRLLGRTGLSGFRKELMFDGLAEAACGIGLFS
jgi:hypothetical protein